MKQLDYISSIMNILGKETAMKDFDEFQNSKEHIFSEEYSEKKEKLLEKAKFKKKKRTWKYMYTAAATAAILIIIPVTVYAAQKLYSTFISKKGYELNYSIIKDDTEKGSESTDGAAMSSDKSKETASLSANRLAPVKLLLKYLPEGFLQDEEMKYSYENDRKGGFSFRLWGVEDATTYKFPYAIDYKEIKVNGNEGIIIMKDSSWAFNRELLLFFEDKGYLVECYVGEDVSEKELMKVAQGITLKEAPVAEATAYETYKPVEMEPKITRSPLPLDSEKINKVGDIIDFSTLYGEELEEANFNFKIENIEVFDSISEFEKTDFLDFIEEKVDKNGVLMEYDRQTIKYGDGINTLDEVISVKKVKRKFLYITVALENKENYAVKGAFITPTLEFLKEVGQQLVPNDENLENDGYPIYLNPHGTGKAYYRVNFEAGEKAVLHIGYIVDEDLLDSAFINICEDSLDSEDLKLIDVRQ